MEEQRRNEVKRLCISYLNYMHGSPTNYDWYYGDASFEELQAVMPEAEEEWKKSQKKKTYLLPE